MLNGELTMKQLVSILHDRSAFEPSWVMAKAVEGNNDCCRRSLAAGGGLEESEDLTCSRVAGSDDISPCDIRLKRTRKHSFVQIYTNVVIVRLCGSHEMGS
jgi:hypothetical protein